jgi:hypothetical protein
LVGSIMSSIQVGRIGNIPIKSKELLEAIIWQKLFCYQLAMAQDWDH